MSHLRRLRRRLITEMWNIPTRPNAPSASFSYNRRLLDPPPVRKMIETGVPIALGSDFNPNACVFQWSGTKVLTQVCVLLVRVHFVSQYVRHIAIPIILPLAMVMHGMYLVPYEPGEPWLLARWTLQRLWQRPMAPLKLGEKADLVLVDIPM
jgi:hypothetical protein